MDQTDHRAGRRAVHILAAGEEQSPEAQLFWTRTKSVKNSKQKRVFIVAIQSPNKWK